MSSKIRWILPIDAMFFCQHHNDLNSYKATMGIMHGVKGTPLNAIRPCEMGVTPYMALDMY